MPVSIKPSTAYARCFPMYAKTTVNIRAAPGIKSKVTGRFYWNDKVRVIKRVHKNWYMLSYKGKNRYICSKYLRRKPYKYKTYIPPVPGVFKSYEDAGCITGSTEYAQGRMKKEYHLDYKSGVWMAGNRYCIAVGSHYTTGIGIKIDLVLSHNGRKHVLECITADSKADKDTVDRHRIHTDGSVTEFIVDTGTLPRKAKIMGDVSYAGKKFKGRIIKIKVYR